MRNTKQAIVVLKKAESSLQRLVAEAASNGDYEAVHTITRWAKVLAELTDASSSISQPDAAVKPSGPGRRGTKRSAAPDADRSNRPKYPQFFRNADSLVKVAWSKASRAEYEHKSPSSVVVKLAAAMHAAGKKSELISMDQVLPLTVDGEEVPSYQSYLCLAWLRHAQLVRQHGRQGYSIRPNTDLKIAIAEEWESLPRRERS